VVDVEVVVPVVEVDVKVVVVVCVVDVVGASVEVVGASVVPGADPHPTRFVLTTMSSKKPSYGRRRPAEAFHSKANPIKRLWQTSTSGDV